MKYLNCSGIPSSVPPKELENIAICVLQEIKVKLDRSQIDEYHRMRKTDTAISKFFNRKNAKTVLLNREKHRTRRYFLSFFFFNDGTQDKKDMILWI